VKVIIAASESLVTYHTVCHGQSFRGNDCLSTLIKKIYEPKFSSAGTKSEAIITNVLSPYILGEVIEDLNKTKRITVSLDISSKKRHQTFLQSLNGTFCRIVVFKTKL
jgi:hypothetical protein